MYNISDTVFFVNILCTLKILFKRKDYIIVAHCSFLTQVTYEITFTSIAYFHISTICTCPVVLSVKILLEFMNAK